MVRHMSGTQWPDDRKVRWCRIRFAPCTRRWGERISWLSLKTKVDGLSVVWPQNHWDDFFWFSLKSSDFGFSSLGLKIDSYSLVIWSSKLLRRFLDLCLKTKRATVCRLHHKTNGRMKTVRDMCWDLAAYFSWKQVMLGFSQSDLKTSGGAIWVVHVASSWLHGSEAEDGWIDVMSCVEPCYPLSFSLYYIIGAI
jgi:hypothetical protein